MKETTKQLASETDRATLRDYLTARLKRLRKELRRASERMEAAYVEGAELEVICAFDELLGEEPPDLRRKPRGH